MFRESEAMEMEKGRGKGGSWRGFFRMIRRIDLPWLMILLTFAVNLTYNRVLLALPVTTTDLMSGSLEAAALTSALLYYISYGAMSCLSSLLEGSTTNLAIRNARMKIWGGMTRIQMSYYDQHAPSALSSAVTNDLEEAVKVLILLMVEVIPDIYYMVEAMRTISSYDIWLLLSVLILLPLKYLYMVVVGRWMYRAQKGIFGQIGELTGFLVDRLHNLPTIKYYTNEEEELSRGGEAADGLYDANMHNAKVSCVSSGLNQLINAVQMIVIVLFGVVLLQRGRIDAAQWVAFFLFSSQILAKFSTLVQDWKDLKSAQGMLARVVQVIDAPEEQTEKEVREAAEAGRRPDASGDIVFNGVSFSYGDKPALRNVSFRVPAGTSAAIVGLCGSGKTTMLNLLERFYEPDEGSILIGSGDISRESLDSLRGRFSYVQQGAGVFGGTVREILTYGIGREVTDDELRNAAESAGAWDFIQNLPGGLDAQIKADGQSVSGGQRQRMVLAREFLRDADILLLDEPTSALDAATAQAVQETIFRMFRGKTILMVTHDLSLLAHMDQIVVMDNGVMDGRGTYDELLCDCPLFREMVRTQQAEEAAT